MKKTVICYFSGSGNSLAVARDLAERLDAELYPMTDETLPPARFEEGSALGLVFPLYDFKPPVVVEELLSRIDIRGTYIFAVATYGVSPGRGLRYLSRLLEEHQGLLSAGVAVPMPHNAVGSSRTNPDEYGKLYREWAGRRDDLAERIRRKELWEPETENLLRAFLKPGMFRMIPAVFHLLFLLVFKGPKSLEFLAGSDCNGCGTCTRVCPRGNITIEDGRPVWGKNCLSCFACLHWCPGEAVSFGGRDLETRRYHHPEVSLKDMIRR